YIVLTIQIIFIVSYIIIESISIISYINKSENVFTPIVLIPILGSKLNFSESRCINIIPNQKLGMDIPTYDKSTNILSNIPPLFIAETSPIIVPNTMDKIIAEAISPNVAGILSVICFKTGL